VHFNRLGNFQSQRGKARFLMKKFAALDFFSKQLAGTCSDCKFRASNQIFSLKFTLTLRAVAGGFILP